MLKEDSTSVRRPSLAALPQLLDVLSPLESMADRIGVARAVARWVSATVAEDCIVHLVEEDGFPKELTEHNCSGPGPSPHLVASVVASSATAVTAGPFPEQAWVVLPLSVGRRAFGALSMLIGSSPEGLGRGDMQGLARVASVLARVVGEARLYERANEVSQALQASLLPGALAEGDWFELAARYVPGTSDLRIGGDWYDSQAMPDGTVALSVGDIAGHGAEAAAQMGELRSAMTALRFVRSTPDELISVVHRLAAEMDYFATVVCARLDPTGNLQWASAGHLPPLVVREDGSAVLLSTDQAPPLGVGYEGKVALNRHRLDPNDTIIIYTDGLVERRDQVIQESLELLSVRASQLARAPLAQLVDRLVAGRDCRGSTGDDIAVLAARWLLPTAPLTE